VPLQLGYACVNTRLPSAARTTRLANATPERLLELTESNLDALAAILRWNREHDVDVFRISSGTVPFGGHPVNTVDWDGALAGRFADVASLLAGVQVSMHPGQFVVLGSPAPHVVDAALADLEYHARPRRRRAPLRAVGRAALGRCPRPVAARARRALELRRGAGAGADDRGAGRRRRVPPRAQPVRSRRVGARARRARRGDVARAPFAAAVDGLDLDCVLEVKDKEQSVLKARGRLYTGAL
jgi:hypothetical protein